MLSSVNFKEDSSLTELSDDEAKGRRKGEEAAGERMAQEGKLQNKGNVQEEMTEQEWDNAHGDGREQGTRKENDGERELREVDVTSGLSFVLVICNLLPNFR